MKSKYRSKSSPKELWAENSSVPINDKSFTEQVSDFVNFKKSDAASIDQGPWSELSKKLDANYISEDLAERAANDNFKFTLSIQLERDGSIPPRNTPIEDNLTEWTEEDSPSIPVAKISFPAQDIKNPKLAALCELVSLSPGHHVSQHGPLSNMGRGRVFTYLESQLGRQAHSDISEEEILKLKQEVLIQR